MAAVISNEMCTGCGRCIEHCPVGAITLYELTKKAIIDAALCIECGICIDECKKKAISIESSGSMRDSGDNRINSMSQRGSGAGSGMGQGSGRGRSSRAGSGSKRPGKGQSGGGCGGRSGTAISGECSCLKCGISIPHTSGVPCNTVHCPKCGAVMVKK